MMSCDKGRLRSEIFQRTWLAISSVKLDTWCKPPHRRQLNVEVQVTPTREFLTRACHDSMSDGNNTGAGFTVTLPRSQQQRATTSYSRYERQQARLP